MGTLLYLSPLLLYFPQFVPGVETQPLLMLIPALRGIAIARNGWPRATLVLLTLFILVICAIKYLRGDALGGNLALLQLIVGPAVFFGAAAYAACPPSRRAMGWVAAGSVALTLLELLLPSAYGSIASAMMDRATVADGHRGVSVLTPEPTYAAISLIYLLLLAVWSGHAHGYRYPWIEWALGCVLAATLSTYAVLFALLLAAVYWPLKMAGAIGLLALALPALSVVGLENEDSVRAVVAISRLLAVDFSEFLPSLSLIDSSLASRLLTNSASYLTPFYVPMGLGLDCESVPTAFDAVDYGFAFSNPVLREVMTEGCLKPQSYLANASLGLGLLAFPFLSLLACGACLALIGQTRHSIWWPPVAVSLLLLTLQGQLTSPISWLLLYIGFADARRLSALHLTQDKSPSPSEVTVRS
jgi:hypothetical protein